MRRRTILTAFGLTVLASPSWAGEAPKEIVEELYQLSARKRGEWDPVLLKPAVRARAFSKALLRAWNAADARNRNGEMGWLDFDLMSNSQDPGVNALRVTVASEAPTKITVRAAFRVDPDPKSRVDQVFYDFILEDESWKLDDIRGNPGGDQWSVRRMARDAVSGKR